MTRDELLEAIRKGAEYLERTDLFPEVRAKAQAKYDRYVAELETLDAQKEPESKPAPPVPTTEAERVAQYMAAIRAKLKPVHEGAKRRGAV